MQEEEARARKAREEEAAAMEFEKWKGEFSVDAEGTTENEVQDGNQGLLSDFVDYIKVLITRVLFFSIRCSFNGKPANAEVFTIGKKKKEKTQRNYWFEPQKSINFK